jgi:uncharacterized protein YbjT (DUF2867 family)
MAGKILVTGATGVVGGEVLKHLRAAGVAARATTRHARSTPAKSDIEWVRYEVGDTGAEHRALEGVERAFLMAPTGPADQYAVLSPWIRAAQNSGVSRIVLMTAQGVDADDRIPFRKAELELIDAGIGYAIVRPAWFMQNFHTFWGDAIRREGVLALPAGDGEIVFVDTRDVGEVAATLLLSESPGNRAVDVTGPSACNHAEAAAILSAAIGRPIRYEDVAPESCLRSLLASGMPREYARLVLDMFAEIRGGAATQVTHAVEEITGRRPRDLAAYARDYRDQLI